MLPDSFNLYPEGVTPVTVVAISRGLDQSVYRTSDGKYTLTVKRQFKAERHRFTIRIDAEKIAADPLASANNRVYSQSSYLVIDRPAVGYSATETANMALGVADLLREGTPDYVGRILAGET